MVKYKYKNKKEQAIKSSAVEVIKHYISADVKINKLEVKNQWLEATLSSGCTLKIKNI